MNARPINLIFKKKIISTLLNSYTLTDSLIQYSFTYLWDLLCLVLKLQDKKDPAAKYWIFESSYVFVVLERVFSVCKE